ncbi:MAG: hypothetical protein M3010_05595 [Candidatus Dormibacteraeota bacterium]|nr:hypothetical protein [Candidatus Dormibacteraeota bacterium]
MLTPWQAFAGAGLPSSRVKAADEAWGDAPALLGGMLGGTLDPTFGEAVAELFGTAGGETLEVMASEIRPPAKVAIDPRLVSSSSMPTARATSFRRVAPTPGWAFFRVRAGGRAGRGRGAAVVGRETRRCAGGSRWFAPVAGGNRASSLSRSESSWSTPSRAGWPSSQATRPATGMTWTPRTWTGGRDAWWAFASATTGTTGPDSRPAIVVADLVTLSSSACRE